MTFLIQFWLALPLFLVHRATSWETRQNLFPKWPATYMMNKSTIIMTCNKTGYMHPEYFPKLARYGIVDIDWSNAKMLWANTAPMDCQERLITQAKAIKSFSPSTKVWIYRNLVKALPWFTDVRMTLLNSSLNKHWFLKFKEKSPYHSPPCTGSKCSMFYHDQLQTPHHGHECNGECDCGTNLPCGEYLYDHRNSSLREHLVNVFILGPKNGTGLNNDAVDGFYIDDSWNYREPGSLNRPPQGFCNEYNPFGGPTEEDYLCVQDMNLSAQDVKEITQGWQQTMDLAQQKIVDAGGFSWRLFHPVYTPNQTECASFLRNRRDDKVAMMLSYTKVGNMTQQEFEVDLAMFLLSRGDYAWLGYKWNGCHSDRIYQWNPMLDRDYGTPLGLKTEIRSGVFQRKWTKCVVEMDCNTYKPSFHFATE